MFRGIQDIIIKPEHKPIDMHIMPILQADELLASDKRQLIIKKLQPLMGLSDDNFYKLCLKLVHTFAETVQYLPETQNSYYSSKGGLLDHALERSQTALSMCRSYFVPDDNNKAPLTQPQTLWAYAMFTAALLYGLGKIVTDVSVEIFDRHGANGKPWNPFKGSMLKKGFLYDYRFTGKYPADFRNRSTLILAKQLMPEEGFRWISENHAVLSTWFAILDDDTRGAGTLGYILNRAEAETINQYFDAREIAGSKEFLKKGVKTTFMTDRTRETLADIKADTKPGEAFAEFLKSSLENGSLMVNKPPLFSIPGGLLISTDAFRYCIDYWVENNGPYKNISPEALENSFRNIKLHERSADNVSKRQFENTKTNKTFNAYVIKNKDLIISNKAANTQRKQLEKSPSIVEVVSAAKPQFISSTGQFVASKADITFGPGGHPSSKG